MKEALDYKKAFEELLYSMSEEYIKGARAMLNAITKEICVEGGCGNCAVCNSGFKFISTEEMKIGKFGFEKTKLFNEIREKEINLGIMERERIKLIESIKNMKSKIPTPYKKEEQK